MELSLKLELIHQQYFIH